MVSFHYHKQHIKTTFLLAKELIEIRRGTSPGPPFPVDRATSTTAAYGCLSASTAPRCCSTASIMRPHTAERLLETCPLASLQVQVCPCALSQTRGAVYSLTEVAINLDLPRTEENAEFRRFDIRRSVLQGSQSSDLWLWTIKETS